MWKFNPNLLTPSQIQADAYRQQANQNGDELDPVTPTPAQVPNSDWQAAPSTDGNAPQNNSGTNWNNGNPAESKYKELISSVWEDALAKMTNQYEQITSVLSNPEELWKLTKEELVQLYNAKWQLEQRFQEIMPILEEKKMQQINSYLDEIDHPEIKSYIADLAKDLDSPEEVESVVSVIKEVVWLLTKWQSKWADSNAWATPANLKNTMWNWSAPQDNWQQDLDPVKAMLSPDPEVRAAARQKFWSFINDLAKNWL